MSGLRKRFFGVALAGMAAFAPGLALAQDAMDVHEGVNSDNGVLYGASINRMTGINANGTPRQQDPGASMTNGAGNSAMTPGVTGPVHSNLPKLHTIPPTAIVHGGVAESQ